ncbi:MAG: putative quinol monooxygenase [Chloroflexota bacterium]
MIIITGTILAKADNINELRAACLEHTRRSRTEPGCLSHDVFVDAENPLRLFFFEMWADQAAVTAHFAVPESRGIVKTLNALAAEPPVMRIYNAEATTV